MLFVNLNILSDFINIRENKFISDTAGVEISNMNPIVKIFTYLYRPLPYEINNYFQLYVSIENVFLILLTLIGIFGFIFFLHASNLYADQVAGWHGNHRPKAIQDAPASILQ